MPLDRTKDGTISIHYSHDHGKTVIAPSAEGAIRREKCTYNNPQKLL
jgi:hypothetical protein